MCFSGRNDGNWNCYLSRPFAVILSWLMCFTERLRTCENKNRLPESSLFFLNNQPDFPTLEELSASVLTANSMTTNAAARGFSFSFLFFFNFMQVKTFPDCLEQKYLTHKPSGEFIYEMRMEVKKKPNKQQMTVRRYNCFRWNIWIMAVIFLQQWTISSLTNQESRLVFMSIWFHCNIYFTFSVTLPQRTRGEKERNPQYYLCLCSLSLS